MPAAIKHTYVPASAGEFHHFVITRHGAQPRPVRVAYERVNAAGEQLSNHVDAFAESAASWNLPPDAIAAFRAQIAAGWRGELTAEFSARLAVGAL